MGLVFTYLRLVMSLRGCEAPVAIRNTLCSFSLLSPMGSLFPSAFSFLCLRRHTFCQQQQKAFTVVSTGFQPRCGVKTGTLPRNHLTSSATGGASAVSAKNQWFLDFLSLQEFRSLWDVVSIDSATDPLPLWWRKCCVYRWGDPFPTVEQHVPSNSQCSGSVSRNTSIPCFGRT